MAESTFKVVISVVDQFTKGLNGISDKITQLNSKMKDLGPTFDNMAKKGGAAFLAIGGGAALLGKASAESERAKATFDALTKSIEGTPNTSIEILRQSTRGLVDDTNLMLAGNKFMAMGLAQTEAEMGDLAEIATRLGTAMGSGATESMENFALMLANQSIPRLDSFGISSGKVRERIDELMSATAGMTREEAFMIATTEQARITMEKLGEPIDLAADKMDRAKANFSNAKGELGEAFIPVIVEFSEKMAALIGPLATWIKDNKDLVLTITEIALTLTGLIATIGLVGKAVNGFSDILMFMNKHPVLAGLALLSTAILLIIQNWEDVKIAVGLAWEWMKLKFAEFVSFMTLGLVDWTNSARASMHQFKVDAGLISDSIPPMAVNAMKGFVAGIRDSEVELTGATAMVVNVLDRIANKADESRVWAQHMMNNFIGGIRSKEGELSGVVNNVVKILEKIKFSKNPDIPSEIWGQHFAENFATGIKVASPQVASSVGDIKTGMLGLSPAGMGAGGGGGIIINVTGNTLLNARSQDELAQKIGDSLMVRLRKNIVS